MARSKNTKRKSRRTLGTSKPPKPRSGKPAEAARPGAESRSNSKTAKMLTLLRRPQGASLGELVRATDWLEHSVRGALSGTIRKKLGLTLLSTKTEKIRRYQIVEQPKRNGPPSQGTVS